MAFKGWKAALLALLFSGQTLAQDFWVDGRLQPYALLTAADRPWRICALLPQGQDRFWWGVSWGLAEQAKALGVKLGIYVATGYGDTAGQRQQWQKCRSLGAQAFIVAAADADGLRDEIKQAMAAGTPVIDLLNGLHASTTSSAVGNVAEMVDQVLDVLLKDAAGRQVSVAWFPGPAASAWADEADAAFWRRMKGSAHVVRVGGRGSTDMKTQATLVRQYFEQHGAPDYLVGNAMAVEFAARLQKTGKAGKPKLLAFYPNEAVMARIASGEVMATVNNRPVLLARLAVDLSVRALQKQAVPSRVAPVNLLLDAARLHSPNAADMLAPEGQHLVRQELR